LDISRNRTIIIGLEGATFDLLDPLIETGDLPRLAELKAESAHGILWSTNPPDATSSWTTCITGVNPGRHGIFDFIESPLAGPAKNLVSPDSARGQKLWDVLNKNNHRSVFINLPVTYPPPIINGCMVSGMLTPDFDSPFTQPPDLRDRLKAVCGNYIPDITIPKFDISGEKSITAYLHRIREALDRRREAVRYLMDHEDWTVFMAVFIGIDRMLRLFAKYLFPQNDLYNSTEAKLVRPKIIHEIQRLDDVVGEIMDKIHSEDTFIALSDHGFGVTDACFNTNIWLMDKGLLAVKSVNYPASKALSIFNLFGENSFTKKNLSNENQYSVWQQIRRARLALGLPETNSLKIIDWTKTKAFFSSNPVQGIYINEKTQENHRGIVNSGDVAALKSQIKTDLKNLRYPETKEKLADAVWFREEIYSGDQTRFAPHILFRLKNYSVTGRSHLSADRYFTSMSQKPIGFYRSNGMLMMKGQHIRKGVIEARMVDIMPTVLFGMGIPVPEGLDGKILTEVFTDSFLQTNSAKHT